MTSEIELTATKPIGTFEVDGSAFHTECETTKEEDAIFQEEIPIEVGNRTTRFHIRGSAEAMAAERRQFFAKRDATPLAVVQAEGAIKNHLFDDVFAAGRDGEVSFNFDGSSEERLGRIDGEIQEVLDSTVGHGDFNRNEMTVLFRLAHDSSDGDDEGFNEDGVDRMEIGVTIGAVHGGRKISVKRNRSANFVEREIRSIGLTFDLKVG